MKCPYCKNSEVYVIDSRSTNLGRRRRYECYHCGNRFTTYEALPDDLVKAFRNDNEVREKIKKQIVNEMIDSLRGML